MIHFLEQARRARRGRFLATAARVIAAGLASVAIQVALLFVFGPFSDRSARELAGGPAAAQGAATLLATGRGWAADAARRRADLDAKEAARQARRELFARGLSDGD